MSTVERRRAQRLRLQCPMIVRWHDGARIREIRAVSENISSNGIYCFVAEGIKSGASVEVMLTLPDQITRAAAVKVHCFGHVQRCDLKGDAKQGMAVAIERFEFAEPHYQLAK